MGRQKVTGKSNREVRKEARGRNRGTGDVLPMYPEDERVDEIGMRKEKYDRSPLQARNENQAIYLEALESKVMIFATGDAGVGKTFLSTAWAADQLLQKNVERIIVTRPMISAEEEMGFLPGTVAEKFMPYFRPVYDVLKTRLGSGFLRYCLREEIEKIEIAPFAFMRGRTFSNAVVILDEAQNVTKSQMKMFLTRLGENVTVIVNGDITQCDLPRNKVSGLGDALTRFTDSEFVSVINFEKSDCVRSDICKIALSAYEQE